MKTIIETKEIKKFAEDLYVIYQGWEPFTPPEFDIIDEAEKQY